APVYESTALAGVLLKIGRYGLIQLRVVHINLMLCKLIIFYKVGIFGRYVMIISLGLCSSGIFYIPEINLYYERSERLVVSK
ncbi:hypothetical protein ALC53_12616, partial [Atta colombica]